MVKKGMFAVSIVFLAAVLSSSVQADPAYALQATHDVEVSNNAPTTVTATGSAISARDTATRRIVSYLRYDVAQIKANNPSKVFGNVQFNVLYAQLSDFNFWGVHEYLDGFSLHGTSYATGPGLVWNTDSVPDTPVVLEPSELSQKLLTVYRSGFTTNIRGNSGTDLNMNDFINDSDDDGVLVFLLNGGNAIIRAIENGSNFYNYNGTNLRGVVMLYDLVSPSKPTRPAPANKSIVASGTPQLKWLNPDPNLPGGVITCDVYLGQTEPNAALPGYGLAKIASGISGTSVPVALQKDQTYKWAVVCHDTTRSEAISSSLWTFQTSNLPPVVDAGANQYLWLGHAGNPAAATAVLDGTLTDDAPEYVTVAWNQTAGPVNGSVVDPNNIVDTTAVISATGTYTFQLTATDPDFVVSDTVTVYVGNTPCDAAKATPGYARIGSDLNNDCKVDLADFSALAIQWMECNVLMPVPCF